MPASWRRRRRRPGSRDMPTRYLEQRRRAVPGTLGCSVRASAASRLAAQAPVRSRPSNVNVRIGRALTRRCRPRRMPVTDTRRTADDTSSPGAGERLSPPPVTCPDGQTPVAWPVRAVAARPRGQMPAIWCSCLTEVSQCRSEALCETPPMDHSGCRRSAVRVVSDRRPSASRGRRAALSDIGEPVMAQFRVIAPPHHRAGVIDDLL
jgi:hypothetical protein